MKSAQRFERADITKEAMNLKASGSVDEPALQMLIADDGPMRCGALPKVETATAAGGKALLDAVNKVGRIFNTPNFLTCVCMVEVPRTCKYICPYIRIFLLKWL